MKKMKVKMENSSGTIADIGVGCFYFIVCLSKDIILGWGT